MDRRMGSQIFGTKINRQRDGRIESYMVGTKITPQKMEN